MLKGAVIKLSVIIPTLNEANNIASIIDFITEYTDPTETELIIVDAESSDGTATIVREKGVKLIEAKKASRASQMNLGAREAKGDILYFVHADVLPPKSFFQDIMYYTRKGYEFGCYRFKFNSSHPLLYINSLFTRFKFLWCRGGDQTLYILRSVFEANGGFNEQYVVMEDFELIKRLWNKHPFKVMPKNTIVSARKYQSNSYWKVNLANLKVFRMFQKGVDPKKLQEAYYQLIDHPKDF